MSKFKELVIKNPAFFMLLLNLFLIISVFLIKDPFGYFMKTYEKSEAFFNFKPSEITEIKISKDKSLIIDLKKEKNIWNVKLEKEYLPAENSKITDLLQSLLKAKKFTELEKTANQEDFGLEKSKAFQIELFQNKKSMGSLKIGSTAPKGSYTYVQEPKTNKIYLVESNLKTKIGRGELDYFYIKNLIQDKLEENLVEKISIIGKKDEEKKTLALIKESKEWYFLDKEKNRKKIKKEEVESLITELNNLSANKILTKENVTLDEPSIFEISVHYKVKDISKNISFKALGKNKNDYFLQIPDKNYTIYQINKYIVDNFMEIIETIETK